MPASSTSEDDIHLSGTSSTKKDKEVGPESFARLSENELRSLIESFHDGVALLNDQGFVYLNRSFCELLGVSSSEELQETNIKELLSEHLSKGKTRFLKSIAQVRSRRKAHSDCEITLNSPLGPPRIVHVYLDALRLSERRFLLLTARDITQPKAIEEELLRTHHLASLGSTVASVAHEINNPLAYVTTNVTYCVERLRYLIELLDGNQVSLGRPESLRAFLSPMEQALHEAHDGTMRIAQIVNDFRDLSRRELETDQTISLQGVLASAVHMAENKCGSKVTILADHARIGDVYGNETRLVQVFVNLIINAAQAFQNENPKRNKISLTTQTEGDF
ncbi:MAG: PAS domain S-box protein, partial [Polyangiaceae bacterium]|nr:PAS domain S-box protein [Polyangiaceae bacterium]